MPFLFVLFSARLCLSRSWWNSWWMCRLFCPFPCSSSGLPSRPLILRFLVVEEVLVEVFKASPRDRAQQRFLELITLTLLFLTVVEEVLVVVFTASPRDRAQQRFVEQNMLTLLCLTVEIFTACRGWRSGSSWWTQTLAGPTSGTPKLTSHGGPCQAPHLLPLRQRGRRKRRGGSRGRGEGLRGRGDFPALLRARYVRGDPGCFVSVLRDV